jgi:acyl-CoA thioester hydrolase
LANNAYLERETNTVEDLCNPITLRVYWEDTDAGGVVYYANYLKFFERARSDWLRQLGVAQSNLQATADCQFVVAEVRLRYLAAARLDDLLTISVKLVEQGRASLLLEQQAWRGHTLLAEGQVRIGCVSASTLRPRRIPEFVSALF